MTSRLVAEPELELELSMRHNNIDQCLLFEIGLRPVSPSKAAPAGNSLWHQLGGRGARNHRKQGHMLQFTYLRHPCWQLAAACVLAALTK